MESNRNYEQILRLARGGATRFALFEYKRFGLDKVLHNEDIACLHGRLYKDLFLSHSGDEALEFAALSAEKYELAFKETLGFYSGINAATMSLLAGFSEDMIGEKAHRILNLLPETKDLSSEAKYFVEATRAEAQFLAGDLLSAQKSLRTAIDHDPLNYIAHASTLKQFGMIAEHRGISYDGLNAFRPPIAVHFAGHMFGICEGVKVDFPCLSEAQISFLEVQISELIQAQDIGFGYGALAAGADIMIAEAILEEGGELHVILPSSEEKFIEASVRPYGEDWVKRFERCLSKASTFQVIFADASWEASALEKEASLSSMGAAIRRAESLSVPSAQILIWDGETGPVGTASDANLWDVTKRPRYVLPYVGERTHPGPDFVATPKFDKAVFSLKTDLCDQIPKFNDLRLAVKRALTHRKGSNLEIKQVLCSEVMSAKNFVGDLLNIAQPGSVVLSEKVANLITLYHFDDYHSDLIGALENGEKVYALREKGTDFI